MYNTIDIWQDKCRVIKVGPSVWSSASTSRTEPTLVAGSTFEPACRPDRMEARPHAACTPFVKSFLCTCITWELDFLAVQYVGVPNISGTHCMPSLQERIDEVERTRHEYNKARQHVGVAHKAAVKLAGKRDATNIDEDPGVREAEAVLTGGTANQCVCLRSTHV